MNFVSNYIIHLFVIVTLFESFAIRKVFMSQKKNGKVIALVLLSFCLIMVGFVKVSNVLEEKAVVLRSKMINGKIDSVQEKDLARSKLSLVRVMIAQDYNTSLDTVKFLLNDEDSRVREWAEVNLQSRKMMPYQDPSFFNMANAMMFVSFILPIFVLVYGFGLASDLRLVAIVFLSVMPNLVAMTALEFAHDSYFQSRKDYVYSPLLKSKKMTDIELKEFIEDDYDTNIFIIEKNLEHISDDVVKFVFRKNPRNIAIQEEMVKRGISIETKKKELAKKEMKQVNESVNLSSFW